ncbi:Kinase suppressor of Ras 1 [Varanus komodoensis]|nr:Kinase suppressor of Ras 1 [Varanus komodoensis]
MDEAAAVRGAAARKMVEKKDCGGRRRSTGGGGGPPGGPGRADGLVGEGPGRVSYALHQCSQLQDLIAISLSSLQGLRTKCAVSNDLTQQEIRTLESYTHNNNPVRLIGQAESP